MFCVRKNHNLWPGRVYCICKEIAISSKCICREDPGGDFIALILRGRKRCKINLEFMTIWPKHIDLKCWLNTAVFDSIHNHKIAWIRIVIEIEVIRVGINEYAIF